MTNISDEKPDRTKELCEELLKIVKEYNNRREDIWLEKIVLMFKKRWAKATIHKWISDLRNNGKLRGEFKTKDGRACRLLFVNEPDEEICKTCQGTDEETDRETYEKTLEETRGDDYPYETEMNIKIDIRIGVSTRLKKSSS